MDDDTTTSLAAPRSADAFALLRAGVPLTLLLDLAAPAPSAELLRRERADTSWVPHAVA